MAYPDELLVRGERVVMHRRPHWKMLILPAVFFLMIIVGGFALAGWLRNWQYHDIAWIVIAAVAVVLLLVCCLRPYIRWVTEHFVITNCHVFFRTGLIRHREHQIPLSHVQNMETAVSFWGRLLGYGSLVVESASDDPLEFANVASLGKVRATLNQLIIDHQSGAHPAEPARAARDLEYRDEH